MNTKKKEYDQTYKKANYDHIAFHVKKGKREEYKQAADDFGISLRELFQTSVEEFIAERSLQSLPVKPASITPPPAEKLTSQEKTLLAEFNQLPADVQKSLLKLAKSINANQSGNVENHDVKSGG